MLEMVGRRQAGKLRHRRLRRTCPYSHTCDSQQLHPILPRSSRLREKEFVSTTPNLRIFLLDAVDDICKFRD